MSYWLVKTEPEEYSFDKLLEEGVCSWEGVRNHQAKNNILGMRPGDEVLVYHSVNGKEVVGIAEVMSKPYPDASDTSERWYTVDLKGVKKLKSPVTLKQIKADPKLEGIQIIKNSRLSVMPITSKHYQYILMMSESK